MTERRPPALILLITAAIALIVFLHAYKLPENTRIWKAIGDAGHVIIFGFLAIIILGISYQVLGKCFKNRLFHYLTAFIITVLIGAISEIIQIFGPRDADIKDFARDIAGALAFLGIYFLADRRIIDLRTKLSRKTRNIIWAGCVIILIGAFYQLGFVISAYIERDKAFPIICSFDAAWESAFWIRHDTEIEIVDPPEGWPHQDRDRVGVLTFDTVTYPGFHIQEPFPDWRNFKYLKFDIYSDLDSTFGLYFRLHDTHHNKDFKDRYNNHFIIKPGLNEIIIPIIDIENAPADRKMDLTSIRTFGIFAYRPEKPFRLFLDNFRLE